MMNAVPSSTRNTLRAERSMMRLSMSMSLMLGAAGGRLRISRFGFCARDRRFRLCLGGMRAEGAERRLEVAFGIDQEVGADHHIVPGLDAVEHFNVAVRVHAELDHARLEQSRAARDQHDLPRAAVEHR